MFASLKEAALHQDGAALNPDRRQGVEITGNLLFTNGMRIDGRVKGDARRPAR